MAVNRSAYTVIIKHVYTPGKTLRPQNTQLSVVSKMWATSYGNRCFNYAAPSIWNTLPADIRESKTIEALKKPLKTQYFQYGH